MADAPQLSVDPEFAALCLALTEEETANLTASLLEDGCRDAIVAWSHDGHPILDGHNRYGICTAEEIRYKVKLLDLPDRQACINWIIRNQLGRRNATEEQKAYLRGKLYRETRNSHGGDRKSATVDDLSTGQTDRLIATGKSTGQVDRLIEGDTAARIAADAGVSERTVRRDAEFSEAVDALAEKAPELKDAAIRGEIPKSAVPALAEQPKQKLRKLRKLSGKDLRSAVRDAVWTCPNCGGSERDEDGDCAKCREPGDPPAVDDSAAAIRQRKNAEIEAFARKLTDLLEEMPDDDWIRHNGRGDNARQKIRDAAATLRGCKCTADCPKCQGEGCRHCLDTGRVPRMVLEQLT